VLSQGKYKILRRKKMKTNKKKKLITLHGDRDLWVLFVNKVRYEKKYIWDVLEVFIKDYLKK
jgi:hypothetical protein